LIKVGQRRNRLILWLIAARILAASLAAELWWVNLGPCLKGPMNRLVDLLAPHAAMGNGFARFLAAVLITAVVYMAMVIVWRIREGYVARRFFRTAERAGDTGAQGSHEQTSHPLDKQMSASAG
jgi:hypothetical protein